MKTTAAADAGLSAPAAPAVFRRRGRIAGAAVMAEGVGVSDEPGDGDGRNVDDGSKLHMGVLVSMARPNVWR